MKGKRVNSKLLIQSYKVCFFVLLRAVVSKMFMDYNSNQT